MVYLSTSPACLDISWDFLLVCHSIIFGVFYYFLFLYTLPLLSIFILIWSLSVSPFRIKVFFASFMFSCDLYASTLWTLTKTCSLVTSFVSFSTVNSLIISVVKDSSFMPLINCFFSLQSFCLYLQSVAYAYNLPIHSYVDFSLLLLSLQ